MKTKKTTLSKHVLDCKNCPEEIEKYSKKWSFLDYLLATIGIVIIILFLMLVCIELSF